MLQVGDKVFIEESAAIDLGFLARDYILKHPYATVKARMRFEKDVPESEVLYALEWPEQFSGGHDCQGTCLPGQGQIVTMKHLSLDFEASRCAETVPQIEGSK